MGAALVLAELRHCAFVTSFRYLDFNLIVQYPDVPGLPVRQVAGQESCNTESMPAQCNVVDLVGADVAGK
jgi:hypothetical protein